MSDLLDERYASFRELAGLRERTATLEASLPAISQALARIESSLAANRQPPTDHVTLALQRALDVFERRPSGGSNPLSIAGLTIVALAVGFVVAKFF